MGEAGGKFLDATLVLVGTPVKSASAVSGSAVTAHVMLSALFRPGQTWMFLSHMLWLAAKKKKNKKKKAFVFSSDAGTPFKK